MRKLTTDEIARKRMTPDAAAHGTRLPIVAILEDIRSLYNVGSMFRTADSARIGKLVLAGYTPHPPRKELDKTALGATLTVPWEAVRSAADVITRYKPDGWTVCAVETTDSSQNIFTLTHLPSPLLLIFGNEITGVRQETLDLCDMSLEIPMHGAKHSLNVSVAFGIVTHEIARRLQ